MQEEVFSITQKGNDLLHTLTAVPFRWFNGNFTQGNHCLLLSSRTLLVTRGLLRRIRIKLCSSMWLRNQTLNKTALSAWEARTEELLNGLRRMLHGWMDVAWMLLRHHFLSVPARVLYFGVYENVNSV